MRFPFIQAEKASYPVAVLCDALEVSRSGFYAWTQRPESKRAAEDRRLSVLVRASFEESHKAYGSPRVLADLVEQGERVSRKRVARLMRASGLRGRIRRRFKNTTMSDHAQPVAPNLLERRFEADLPNQRWVGDTTELLVGNGRLYLAVLIDLFSRYVVGWSLSTVNDRQLVVTALEQALQSRRPEPGLLHHSDQGSPYASEDYRRILDLNGFVCSMSRRGNCLDNAVAESWFSTLKFELGETFDGHAQARQRLFEYIEIFYNRKRRHSVLGYVSPARYERSVGENQSEVA